MIKEEQFRFYKQVYIGRNISLIGIIVATVMFICIIVISLIERNFELSLLRTMGLFPSKIGQILMMENLILSLVGVLLGCPLSIILFRWLVYMSNQDIITVPNMEMSIYGFIQSFLGIFIVTLICYLLAVKSIKRIEMTYSDFT